MDQRTNLAGMPPDDAKRYILAHITDLNLLKKRIEEAKAETAMWRSRVDLAAAKGMAELQAQAEAALASANAKTESLSAEASALQADIDRMREQIPGLEARVRSIDPDVLLAGLQMVTGEMEDPGKAKLESDVKSVQADDALAALKSSLGLGPATNESATESEASGSGSADAGRADPGQSPAPSEGTAGGGSP